MSFFTDCKDAIADAATQQDLTDVLNQYGLDEGMDSELTWGEFADRIEDEDKARLLKLAEKRWFQLEG
jgi:hypothetical protein